MRPPKSDIMIELPRDAVLLSPWSSDSELSSAKSFSDRSSSRSPSPLSDSPSDITSYSFSDITSYSPSVVSSYSPSSPSSYAPSDMSSHTTPHDSPSTPSSISFSLSPYLTPPRSPRQCRNRFWAFNWYSKPSRGPTYSSPCLKPTCRSCRTWHPRLIDYSEMETGNEIERVVGGPQSGGSREPGGIMVLRFWSEQGKREFALLSELLSRGWEVDLSDLVPSTEYMPITPDKSEEELGQNHDRTHINAGQSRSQSRSGRIDGHVERRRRQFRHRVRLVFRTEMGRARFAALVREWDMVVSA